MEAGAAEDGTARWVVCPAAEKLVNALIAAFGCPPAIARMLVSRGLCDVEDVRRFLNPSLDDLLDPSCLLGMAAAVDRIEEAVRRGERILIYGDYDVDGTVATVLLKTAIERAAASLCKAAPDTRPQVTFHVPHRLREGYGMQNNILGQAAADGVKLVISVDTGIRAFAAAAEAKALGLDLIVTDHHLPDGASGLPEAVAVINPAQSACGYANKSLCGAGVAFKLAHALLRSAAGTTPAEHEHLERVLLPSFLKLLAIATIADSVPLTGENRSLVWLGLRELRHPVQPGLRALMEVAELSLDRSPSASDVGFRLAPRINAAGRMDVASDVVDLFLTRDPLHAAHLARKLNDLNQDRRATEAAALQAIELQLLALRDPHGAFPAECLVLSDPQWHRGVLGILASRVVERTQRPALILSEENGDAHGSGRSIPGFHLLDALSAVHRDELFSRFGGHAHAVGFSLASGQVETLRERMREHSAALLDPGTYPHLLQPPLACDVELLPGEITRELLHWLRRCEPFGIGHPEPVFISRGLRLTAPVRIIKERHVCLALASSHLGGPVSPGGPSPPMNAMGWSRPGSIDWPSRCAALALIPGASLDVAFRLRENKHPQYRGIELELVDIALGAEPAWIAVARGQPEQKAASFPSVGRLIY